MVGDTIPRAKLEMACLESLSMTPESVEIAAKAMAASSASTAKGVLTVPAVTAGLEGAEEDDTETITKASLGELYRAASTYMTAGWSAYLA